MKQDFVISLDENLKRYAALQSWLIKIII